MSLNQQVIAEFSPCTPSAPQLRDFSIQTLRQLALISNVDKRFGDLTDPGNLPGHKRVYQYTCEAKIGS
jgi:hypothetical protein